MRKITIPYEELYDLYIKKNYSMKRVAEELKLSRGTIAQNLKEYGIESHKISSWCTNKRINLTSEQMEVVNGALLGDGCLYLPHNGNAQLIYTSKFYNHVEFIYKYLKDFVTSEGIKKQSYYDKRTGKTYTRFVVRTQLNEFFTDLYKEWYRDIKIIPQNLQLTSLMCLVWYIGDGSLLTGSRTQYIKLATHCFTYEDLIGVILPQLSKFEARLIKAKGDYQYFIYIPHRRIKDFLSYVGNCPFEEYKYKWAYREYKGTGFVSQPHTDKEEQFLSLYKDGWTYYKIAKHFGVEPGTVKYYLVKNNIYKRGEKHDEK